MQELAVFIVNKTHLMPWKRKHTFRRREQLHFINFSMVLANSDGVQNLFPSFRNDFDTIEEEDEEVIDFLTDTELPSINQSSSLVSKPAERGGTMNHLSKFDPFSPERPPSKVQGSLLDDEVGEDESHNDDIESSMRYSLAVPGAAGYLEMEDEPPRTPEASYHHKKESKHRDFSQSQYEPIKTSSGLLLTHRRTPTEYRPASRVAEFSLESEAFNDDDLDQKKRQTPRGLFGSTNLRRALQQERFEFERVNPFQSGSVLLHGQKLLSFTKLWLMISALFLFIGMMVIIKHVRHEGISESEAVSNGASELIALSETVRIVQFENHEQNYDQLQSQNQEFSPIVLLPLPAEARIQGDFGRHQRQMHTHPLRRLSLKKLRREFESWASKLNKTYPSEEEKEKRFSIWKQNSRSIAEKNRRHGPCKLTKQPVFGSNRFQDLTHEEFKEQFLTGYTGPTADKEPHDISSGVLGPHIEPKRHPAIHHRLQERWKETVTVTRRGSDSGAFGTTCKWYDVSCVLTYVFETYVYGLGLTLEPAFDSQSYPKCKPRVQIIWAYLFLCLV